MNWKDVASTMLSSKVESLEMISGGRNSQVYRLIVRPSRSYALKAYFQHPSDQRDRLQTEFSSLTFLRAGGITTVPAPVSADRKHNCAIYEWIDGRKVAALPVSNSSLQAAISFLARLGKLRERPESRSVSPASEACFSGAELLKNLQSRLQPLLACLEHPELQAFLARELLPAFDRIVAWSCHRLGGLFDQELRPGARTLSPSDFGFHNALQKPDGEIVFLDFEYFGWDDPAKMISDFLLHPAMDLSSVNKSQFAGSVVRSLSWSSGLPERLTALYPLYGLKWCLILLNEFLPGHLLRRQFAGMNDQDLGNKQKEQLVKAKTMLQRITGEYEHFPYL